MPGLTVTGLTLTVDGPHKTGPERGRLKMQDLENVWVARCLCSQKPTVFFVVEIYCNYLEQVTYLLLLIVK